MTTPARLVPLLAAALLWAGCASPPPPPPPRHPYRAILLPVTGARAALAVPHGEDSIPVAATPEELEARILAALLEAPMFSAVEPVDAAAMAGCAPGEELARAAAVAAEREADLILRVQLRAAGLVDLGHNSSTAWSCFLWIMIPLPTWFVNDRSYAVDFRLHADLFTVDDLQRPLSSFVVSAGERSLDLWERGVTLVAVVCPPPFLPGNEKTLGQVLTDAAVEEVTRVLVEEIRGRQILSIFELRVEPAPGGLRVLAASRRKLRAVEVRSGGRVLRSWAESDLEPDEVSADRGYIYRRDAAVEVPSAAGIVVRVIVDDEVGAREVRTLVLGKPAAAAGAGGRRR